MRVATRRLRAALRMFRPVLPEGFAEQLVPPMRELMRSLGQVRDLDVLMARSWRRWPRRCPTSRA
jgi:CHAD domain-containing protein